MLELCKYVGSGWWVDWWMVGGDGGSCVVVEVDVLVGSVEVVFVVVVVEEMMALGKL
ncbi:hypothetical protein DPMN_107737 [Dreissena polymorpha]|uniref:Uncharacterized protein n=1 Tax=Dreissena polymorpha TaxID=45954 RepID=A0A9D4K7C1_DREPO|nr:hypothetical protein DPMN_107737 [Dreissena polymorpha]